MSSDSTNHEPDKLLAIPAEPEVVEAIVAQDVEAPVPDSPINQLSYLHPTSLVFDLMAHGRTYLVPAAFGVWGAAKGDVTLLIISAMIFIPAVMVSVIRYFTFRYSIQDDELVVTQGLIFRNARTVPVARIQNIDFVQNPLHRMLKVAEVKVETASGTKPEATLRVLSMVQMENLRSAVFGGSNAQAGSTAMDSSGALAETDAPSPLIEGQEVASTTSANAASESTLLKIPLAWLVKAGLASNRGLIMVGVLLGAFYQFGDRSFRTVFSLDWINRLFPAETSTAVIIATAIIGFVAAMLLLRMLGIGWFILRFYGYQLSRRGDDLRISCGLLTKVSATVPRQRIQFISIHRTLIMRMLGLASIRIETAGGAGSEGENATETVSKRWFVPVIPENRVAELLTLIRPGLDWDESGLDFQPLAPRTGVRLCRVATVQAVIFAAAGLAVTRPWGWTIGVAALPLLVWWAIKKSKSMKYARTSNGVVYRSGVFNRRTSMTFFEKIQTLTVDQSPFDRRWKMARLSVDTAAAGPADHSINVRYLDEEFARAELQVLRLKTGQEQPVFG